MKPNLRARFVFLLLVLLTLVPGASATWSIVAVNKRTGEVCIASATCIPRVDLTEWTPVILVGRGGDLRGPHLTVGDDHGVREGAADVDSQRAQGVILKSRAQ